MAFKESASKKLASMDGSLKETEDSLAHTKLGLEELGRTASPASSLEERMLAQEAGTNSFAQRLSKRNLSLRMCLRIFFLSIFQLVCAALLLGNCSFTTSFHTASLPVDQLQADSFRNTFQTSSLQPEELVTAYSRDILEQQSLQADQLLAAYRSSFQQPSLQQDEHAHSSASEPRRGPDQLESVQQKELSRKNQLRPNLIAQLDLDTSLSLTSFSLFKMQLLSFSQRAWNSSSFEQRALPCCSFAFQNQDQDIQLQDRSGSELSAYRAVPQLRFCFRGSLHQIRFADKSFKPTFALPSFDLDKLELGLSGLAQTFKP